MLKKVIGIILVILSLILCIVFISKGLIVPHLVGPILIGLVGVIVLASKSKRKA